MARTRKRRTAAQRRATRKMIAANRRRRGHTGGHTQMATKHRKRARGNPTHRRRRSTVTRHKRRRAGRNPPIVALLRKAATIGGAALVGGIATRQIANYVPVPAAADGSGPNPTVQSIIDLAIGLGIAVVADSVPGVSAEVKLGLAAGAVASAGERILRRHLDPTTATKLLGEDVQYGLTPGIPGGYGQAVGRYPAPARALPAATARIAGMGLYPSFDGQVSSDDM
jgi:hypothetical protein